MTREAALAEIGEPASAAAVDPAATPPPSLTTLSAENRRRLRVPASLWVAGTVADHITTYQFASRYGDLLHEQNLLLAGLDGHPALLVTAGAALDAATAWATYRFIAPKHPRLARVLFYGAAAYRSYLAIHNTQMMRRAVDVRALSSPPSPISR